MRKMIKKIVLILIVSLFSISVAYASNINQLDGSVRFGTDFLIFCS